MEPETKLKRGKTPITMLHMKKIRYSSSGKTSNPITIFPDGTILLSIEMPFDWSKYPEWFK